tara:strand:+ start:1366 stop:2382 length:1017 start_codon:yes stop_codon:yes gene_type:complete
MSNNIKIIELLKLQKQKYINTREKYIENGNKKEAQKYVFKARSMQKGIDAIVNYGKKLKFGSDIADVKGVGKGIIERIDEIIKTGTLKEIEKNMPELHKYGNKNRIIDLLCSITGVGQKRAKEWFELGIKTISDVRNAVRDGKIKITHHIEIGLKYYEDFNKKIKRKTITKINKLFSKLLKEVNPDLIHEICGSYRRGLPESGDIDIIITNTNVKGEIKKYKFLTSIVKKCIETGFIIDNLTNLGEKKYMGVCKIAKQSMRIDIRCFNSREYGTAILYFTGSRDFNIYMRNEAIKLGYRLNEYCMIEKSSKKKIYFKTENDIFKKLSILYVKPIDRNI